MAETLSLTVPARPFALSLIRLQVGGVAAILGALITEVEDLQLATDELCLDLLGADGSGDLVTEITWADDVVEVRCHVEGRTAPRTPHPEDDALPDGIVDQILGALVDEHGTSVDGDRTSRWLRKRVGSPPAP